MGIKKSIKFHNSKEILPQVIVFTNEMIMNKTEILIENLEMSLLALDREKSEKIIHEALLDKSPSEVAANVVAIALQNIGSAWEEGKIALSQIYMSGIICEELIDKVLPPTSSVRISQPKIAIAVFEDYHLLGKRIVAASLRSSGFEITDLGGGLSIDQIVEKVKKGNYKVLLLSVLMLHSALHVKVLKEKLKGLDVKIIVGGAPFRFDTNLWKEVGADGFGKDSSEAISIVTKIVEEMA